MLSLHLNYAAWFLSEIKAEQRVNTSGSARRMPSLILDPRQLAIESYEWGLKPRNMTTTKQTNKQTSFIPLFAIKTELSSDKIDSNDTIIYIKI